MKVNQINDITKVLILAASIIVVCIICAVGYKLVNEGKSAVTANSNQLVDMSGQFLDIDVSLYDGSIIMGSEVISLIKRVEDSEGYLSIKVHTLDGSTKAYHYAYDEVSKVLSEVGTLGQVPLTEPMEDRTQMGYINSMAAFAGETFQDNNGNIACIYFTQQP